MGMGGRCLFCRGGTWDMMCLPGLRFCRFERRLAGGLYSVFDLDVFDGNVLYTRGFQCFLFFYRFPFIL